MAIRLPDPYSHPNQVPGFEVASVTDNSPSYIERLPSGKILEVNNAAQYWSMTLNFPAMYTSEFLLIQSAIFSAKSSGDKISLILPHYEDYAIRQNTSTMSIASGQVGSTLVVTGYTDSKKPLVGKFIKLSNHTSKVYKVTSANKAGSTLTLGIYPNLAKKTSGVEKPIFNNVLFECWLENPNSITEVFSTDGVYEEFSLTFRENIS